MCAKRGLRDGDGRSTDGGTVPTREVDTRTVVRAERRRAAFRGPRDEEKGRFPNKKQQSSKRLTDAQQRQLQGNQGDARSLPWLQLSVDRGHSLPVAAVDESRTALRPLGRCACLCSNGPSARVRFRHR